jgi:hypothetical protein
MMWIIILLTSIVLTGCTQKTPQQVATPVPETKTTVTPYPVASTKPALSVNQSMQQQIAAKYKKSADTVTITVSKEEEGFAKGMVSFKNEEGGAMWFAALEKGGWILVHDGQGSMTCELADQYAFPTSFVSQCLTKTGTAKNR